MTMTRKQLKILLLADFCSHVIQLKAALSHVFYLFILIWEGRKYEQTSFSTGLKVFWLRLEEWRKTVEQQNDERNMLIKGCYLLFAWADAGRNENSSLIVSLKEHSGFLLFYFFRCEMARTLNLEFHRVVEKETVSYGLHLGVSSIDSTKTGEILRVLAFQ